ncbi:RIKEN cDNA 1110006O24, partial [Mus musculus]
SGSGLGSVGRMHPARQRLCSFCLSFPDAARSQPHVFFQLERKPTCPSPRAVAAIAILPAGLQGLPHPCGFLLFPDKFSSIPGWLPDSLE